MKAKIGRKIHLLISLFLFFFLIGCMVLIPYKPDESISSGLLEIENRQIPMKVGVSTFSHSFQDKDGPYINHYGRSMTKIFSEGLKGLGFNIVSSKDIDKVIGYKKYFIHHASLLGIDDYDRFRDLISDEDRRILEQEFGLEAIFIGTAHFKWDSVFHILVPTSRLFLLLIDIKTGKVIWAANCYDPRTSRNISPTAEEILNFSEISTTNEALRLLEKDIKLFNTKFERSGLK